MWMAEWLFTDLFDRGNTAPGGLHQDARPDPTRTNSPFANRANDVENSHHEQQNGKKQPEEQFSRQELAHEIKLEHEQSSQSQEQPVAKLRVLFERSDKLFEIRQNRFHGTSPSLSPD
jgi:hypothetical protein